MRVLSSLLLLILAACGQAETSAQAPAGVQPSGTGQAPAKPIAPGDGPLVLEFNLPDGFETAPVGNAAAVTGFRVGYFKPTERAALRTLDVGRDALTVRGRTARVTLPRDGAPGCAGDCTIRLQTLLSSGRASAWSEPVPLTGLVTPQSQPTQGQPPPEPANPPRAADQPPQDASRAVRRNGLTPGDIEPYPALSESLRKLPADASIEDLQRFRRVSDLAMAVVISREYDIPLATFSRTLEGPPRLSVRNAFAKLRPDENARSVLRKLRPEALRLTNAPGDTDAPQ